MLGRVTVLVASDAFGGVAVALAAERALASARVVGDLDGPGASRLAAHHRRRVRRRHLEVQLGGDVIIADLEHAAREAVLLDPAVADPEGHVVVPDVELAGDAAVAGQRVVARPEPELVLAGPIELGAENLHLRR